MRHRLTSAVTAVLFVALVLARSAVAFADTTPIEVQVEAGTGIDAHALEGHLSVELDRATAPVRVEIVRQGTSLRVRLVYADGSDERLGVDVTDVPDASAPRVLALAIGEAARLHVARPPLAPSPPTSSAVPVAPRAPTVEIAPAPRPAPTPTVHVTASVSVGARGFGAAGNVGVEPRLALGLVHRSGLVAEIGGAYFTAGASDPLGDVRLHVVIGSLGVAYELALSSAVRLRAGPRIDLGAAFGSGSATGAAVASSTSAPFASLVGDAVLAIRLGPKNPWLTVALDAGGALRGLDLRADDRTPLAALGATFGARLGLGLR